MTLNVEKRFLALFLAFIMVVSLLPWWTVEVHADYSATPIAALDNKVTISGNENSGQSTITLDTSTANTYKISMKNEADRCATGQAYTIKVTASESVFFSFDYSAENPNAFTMDGVNIKNSPSGSWKGTLNADKSVTFVIKNKDGNATTGSLTLSNFKYETVTAFDITLIPGENGMIKYNNEDITTQTVKQLPNTDTATLTATANSGYIFAGWQNESGQWVSADNPLTIQPGANATYQPQFVSSVGATFSVGGYKFDDLQKACDFANSDAALSKTVVLLNNGTLPAGDYIIPSGVTLLIPCDANNTVYTTKPNQVSANTKPTAYKTLSLESGANIAVYGSISIAGSQSGKQTVNGCVSGPVGFIKMSSQSTITLESGSFLYAWGYITGSGSVEAKSGSTVYESFQLTDFRGGQASAFNMPDTVFPMSQYYMQNIEVPLTLHAGASEYAYMSADMTMGMQGAAVPAVTANGDSNLGMFRLTSGYVIKDFNETTGRMEFIIRGDVSISPIKVTISIYPVDSDGQFLPIPGHMTVRAESGTVTLNQDLALLPGSQLFVGENAVCNIGSGKKIVVYDADEWGNYCGHQNYRYRPLPYAPGGKVALDSVVNLTGVIVTDRDKDAMVVVNGTINAKDGYVYTTSGGANIYTDGSGVIVTTPGTDTKTYQASQSGTDVRSVTIAITPAVLKNGNGTYTETAGAAAGTTYEYCETHERWYTGSCGCCGGNHTAGADATCTTAQTCTICGTVLVEAKGHTPNADDGNCTTAITCSVCNAVTTAAKDSHSYGTTAAGDKHSCTVSGCTQKIACSDSDTDKDHVCDFGCGAVLEGCSDVTTDKDHSCDVCGEENITSHSYGSVVTDPTCTEKGYTTYTCNCGHSYKADYVEVNPNNHIHKTEHVQQDATCLDKGYTAGTYCEDCDKWISGHEEIPAIGHKNKEHHEKVDATCVATGTIEYWSCPDCGKNFSDESCTTEVTDLTIEIDATNHVHKTEHVQQDATCLDKGYTAGTYCEDCDKWISGHEEIPAIGHSYSAVVTKPTCEDGGYTTYTCNCGHTYTADHTKQLGHAWGEPKYIINDDGTHTEMYTCGNDATHFKSYAPVKHIYTNGMCDCGAIWLEVKAVGSMNYVVDGQTVKVVHDKPCRVGYLLDGSYVAITGVANGDGSYSFTAPAGVTEVLVVEKGEVNGDGRISAPDVARINAHILNKITLTAEALFAADANGDGFVNSDDLSVLSYAVLGKESLAWELTSTEH